MNWDAIGAIGEIAGAIAVFASLIYLAIQIRQNTRSSRSATRQAITETIMTPPNNFLQSETFLAAFLAHINGSELSQEQRFQLQVYCYITMRSWENMHYQYLTGMVSEEEWLAFRANLKAILEIPIYRDYWVREREIYTSRFRNEVEHLLGEISDHSLDLPEAFLHLRKQDDA